MRQITKKEELEQLGICCKTCSFWEDEGEGETGFEGLCGELDRYNPIKISTPPSFFCAWWQPK